MKRDDESCYHIRRLLSFVGHLPQVSSLIGTMQVPVLANRFKSRLLLIGFLLLAGCGSRGPRMYPVTGEVVFEDGVALQGGIVEFTAVEQEISSSGRIGPDGKFQLTTINEGDGAVAGEHRAIVITSFGDGLVKHNHDAKTLRRPAKKFANYKTSGLKFTVKPGEKNHFQVVIQRAK